jgi:hypothetical protein
MAVEPELLKTVRKAGERLVKLADNLDRRLEDAANAVLEKPTEAKAPKARANGSAKEMPPAQEALQ